MKKSNIFTITFIALGLMLLPQVVFAQATYTARTSQIHIPYVDIKDGEPYEVTFTIEETSPDLLFTLTNAMPVVDNDLSVDATFDPSDGSMNIRSLHVIAADNSTYNLFNVSAQLNPSSSNFEFTATGVLSSNLDGTCWDENVNNTCDSETEDKDLDGACTILDCQDSMIETLKEKLPFVNDITTFTLYSFMDYTGCDNDYMHPLRQQVREELDALSPELTNNSYCMDFNDTLLWLKLGRLLSYLGTPPVFLNPSDSEYDDIGTLLTEFYQKADIASLYAKYDPYYQEMIVEYENQLYPYLAKFLTHFNLDALELQLRLTPLNSNGGFASSSFLMLGVNRASDAGLLLHEYAHKVEMPLRNSDEVVQLSSMLERTYGSTDMVLAANNALLYPTWSSVIGESFVRAISGWGVQGAQYINEEVDDGFVLTGFFYDRIESYDSTVPFETWFKELIVEATAFLEAGGIWGSYQAPISLEVGDLPGSASTSGSELDISLSRGAVNIEWSQVSDTDFYRLYYAPYSDISNIGYVDISQWSEDHTTYVNRLNFDVVLPAGSAYYVAVESHNNNMGSQGMTAVKYFIVR